MTEATLEYTNKGKIVTKKISVPDQRYGLGIVKVREEVVVIGWFKHNPKLAGYSKDNYFMKYVKVPYSIGSIVRLKIGDRTISKSR